MSTRTASDGDGPRQDPSRTTTLQRDLQGQLSQRAREVRGQVRSQIEGGGSAAGEVALAGLGGLAIIQTFGAFRRWLSGLFGGIVIETTPQAGVRRGSHWTASTVESAYESGLRQARAALRGRGYDVDTRNPSAVMADERHQRALSNLYEQTYFDLQDAVENTQQEVRRAIADGGFVQREADDVAKRELIETINERIEANTGKRFEPVGAITPVRSANQAALSAYERAGVEEVGVEPEADVSYQTAQDRYVCQQCRDIAADNPYAIGDVPIPPVHPRCRCFILPL